MSDTQLPPDPEMVYFAPTADTPNNVLPVLIYRAIFPSIAPVNEVRAMMGANRWAADANAETHKTPIFHSKAHEGHVICRGRCQFLVGGAQYGQTPGQMISLQAGDIIIYPAGVSHCLIQASPEFEYITIHPDKSSHKDDCQCSASQKDMKQVLKNIGKVNMPKYDPVYGKDGPLVELWKLAVVRDNIANTWW